MGCVWQSEYAPVPRPIDARAQDRPAARHRKPAWWRRAGRSALPGLAAAGMRLLARPYAGKLAVLAQER
jgi:hypothetical protein